jgi:hypothetical protein
MNAAVFSFGCEDFTSSIAASARRSSGGAAEMPSLGAASDFFPSPLAPAGIADSVNQIAVGRSATLPPALRQRITELSSLKPNWDDEGAIAVKSFVLADVVEALKRFAQRTSDFREPFLAPTFDGFVQMEWHDKKRCLEIEAVEQGWTAVGTMIGNDGKRHYFSIECERSNFERLEKFYEWFVGIELLWPSL